MPTSELDAPIRTTLDPEQVILAVVNYTDRPIRRASAGSIMSLYDLRYYFDNYVVGASHRGVVTATMSTADIYMSPEFLESLGARIGMTSDNGTLVLDQTQFDRKFGRGRLQQVIDYVEHTHLTGTGSLRTRHLEEESMEKYEQVSRELRLVAPFLASLGGVAAGVIMEIELFIFAGAATFLAAGVRHLWRRPV